MGEVHRARAGARAREEALARHAAQVKLRADKLEALEATLSERIAAVEKLRESLELERHRVAQQYEPTASALRAGRKYPGPPGHLVEEAQRQLEELAAASFAGSPGGAGG